MWVVWWSQGRQWWGDVVYVAARRMEGVTAGYGAQRASIVAANGGTR